MAMLPSVGNLVKNIAGAGVLSLPAGIAAFSDAKGAALPACALVGALGMLSCYTFVLIGRLCEMTKTQTYKEAVSKSMGDTPGKVLAAATTMKTAMACFMYSIIIGDTTAALAQTFGAASAFPVVAAYRWKLLALTTATVLTPLCLLRSFAFLAYTSLVGIAGTLYTAGFMGKRLFDGSYAPGGRFFQALQETGGGAVLPAFGGVTSPAGSFVLVSMLATAFIAHYNAPRFYRDLEDATPKRFAKLGAASFGISALIFGSMMSFGFLTFGSATTGYILNNYASTDGLATAARVAILLSITLGYPLTFVSLRDGILEMAKPGQQVSWRTKDACSLAILALITTAATFVRNLGLVASVGGAVLGSLVIYIFPALSFIAACKKQDGGVSADQQGEVRANYGVAALGMALGVIGTAVSLNKA